MYLITFKGDEADIFRVLYDAVKRPKQGTENIRPQAKVLRKMNKISDPTDDVLEIACACGRKTKLPEALQLFNVRMLKAEGGYFEIDGTERKLIETQLNEYQPAEKFVIALDDAMSKILEAKDYPDSDSLQAAVKAWKEAQAVPA